MLLQSDRSLPKGFNSLTARQGAHPEMMMDFAALRLGKGDVYANQDDLERALLLVYGQVRLEWDGHDQAITRVNCYDENPWLLHLPAGMAVKVTGVMDDSEISYIATVNDRPFSAKIYAPNECRSEERGKGTMQETSTRIVRTVVNFHNAPYAKLVIGEVVAMPGKWSSYPPHGHPQPEIYYYKFYPEGGYGLCELGDNIIKVRHNSVALITEGVTHPQVAAPGYAMWYLWVIRHLDNNPYINPTFKPEHIWVTEPDAVFWPNKPSGD